MKYKINNKMKPYGKFDPNKNLIEINKKKAKKGNKGELLDSIVHETLHAKHQKKTEMKIRKMTERVLKKLSQKQKKKYYSKVT